MNNCKVGIFDSGIGGLTCVKEFNKILPNENVVYFGDTARIPYGTRSAETVARYAAQDIALIKKYDVKLIIAACGTVSSIIGEKTNIDGTPFTGVVIPASKAAVKATKNGKIGIIGTSATVHSKAYNHEIYKINSDIKVYSNACPLFVTMVENGIISSDDIVVKEMVKRYLSPLKENGVDTVILGCTHYPMLEKAIGEFMGNDVTLISSGAEAAKTAKEILSKENLLTNRSEKGTNIFISSDSKEMFEINAHRFLGDTLGGDVYEITMEDLMGK